MFRAKPLLVLVIIFLFFSCSSADKQTEQANTSIFSTDTTSVSPRKLEINPKTKKNAGKKLVASKAKKTPVNSASDLNASVQASLENDFRIIEPDFQDYLIHSNIDTTIFCKEGTIIKIRHSSFVTASKPAEVTGTILFQVKEFYKISDILSARLTTLSGDRLLETGGMLFIQATSNGQPCKIKGSSAITISFPFKEQKGEMRLFGGSWVNKKMNWELLPWNEDAQSEIADKGAEFPGGAVALERFIYKHLVYPDSLADMGIGSVIEVNFEIDEMGKVKDVAFKSPSQQGFKEAILKAVSKMPKWKPAKRNGIFVESNYPQSITFSTEGGTINDTTFKKEFELTINDSSISKVNAADVRRYIFSASNLGWINCDRFYDDLESKTDLYVDCGNYSEVDIKLVFHSFRSVLDNYISKKLLEFRNIPDNEPVTVVVVKKINGHTFISLTKSNTNIKLINNLVFEKVTIGKLREKLAQLTNVWQNNN